VDPAEREAHGRPGEVRSRHDDPRHQRDDESGAAGQGRREDGDEGHLPRSDATGEQHQQDPSRPGDGEPTDGQEQHSGPASGEIVDQQPGVQAPKQPAEAGPGDGDEQSARARRPFQRLPPGHSERPVQQSPKHGWCQADRDERREGHEPPVAARGARGRDRQRRRRDKQGAAQRDRQGYRDRRHAATTGYLMVTPQLNLGREDPHRAGQVLAQLGDRHDPNGRREGEFRA
jgi:hypothetical protein